MYKDYPVFDKKSIVAMISRSPIELIFCLGLFSLLTGLFLFSSSQVSFAQLPSSTETSPSLGVQRANNSHLAELEAAREQYLTAWNSTAFSSQLDVFIAEGTDAGYGVYREHIPANVFRPGETIVLYVEPVGFGHQAIRNTSTEDVGINNASVSMPLYLVDMTVDIIISDAAGTPLQALEDLPGASFISHGQNTEFPVIVTLTQSEPFPVGDYILTYVVHDQVTGQSFQLDRQITIDDNAVTGAAPLPDFDNDNSTQSLEAQQELDEPSRTLEP
jgi:hypothetical protein